MRLSDLISPGNIIAHLESRDLSEALNKILVAAKVTRHDESLNLLGELEARKEQGGTLLGNGIYFPHARIAGLEKFYISMGVSSAGIDAETPDGEPVHFAFLILVPFEKNALLLKTRAAFLKFFISDNNASRLLSASSAEAIYEMIEKSGVMVEETLTAKDVMETNVVTASPDLTLRKLLELMLSETIESLPVVDEKGKLVGVVTGHEVLRLAIPRFADGLTSLRFVQSRAPFDKILARRDDTKVADIMEKDVLRTHPGTSLVQIAHMLASTGKRYVYIVDEVNDGRFLGIVSRRGLLVKVLVE